jgi:hypothetical protein
MTEGNGKLTKEAFAALKDKHGEVMQVDTPVGSLVFERPPQPVWDRWVEACSDDRKSKSLAMLQLALGSLVYPDQAAAELVFKKYPGIPSALSGKLSEFAGAGDAFSIKVV